ncbi:unnamed protein product [Moneuplotes crassus]|uniref:Uncharacterized protein n=1 Tax=Euplotes crassus TaxID=5936 RepID=A0AAD1XT68_EUPCR|nr:unnamed protein product [Moneuplotes crassus]
MIDETVDEENNPMRVNISLTTSKQTCNNLSQNKGNLKNWERESFKKELQSIILKRHQSRPLECKDMGLLESSEFKLDSFKSLNQPSQADLDSPNFTKIGMERRVLGENSSKDRIKTKLEKKYSLMKNSKPENGFNFLSSQDGLLENNLLAVPRKTFTKRRKSAKVRSGHGKTGPDTSNAWVKIKEVKFTRKDYSTQGYMLDNHRIITMEDVLPC